MIRVRPHRPRHFVADAGSAGPKRHHALGKIGERALELVNRSDTATGLEVIPRRWVFGRIFAWLGRCRRRAKDEETALASAGASILVGHIRLLTRRIARRCLA